MKLEYGQSIRNLIHWNIWPYLYWSQLSMELDKFSTKKSIRIFCFITNLFWQWPYWGSVGTKRNFTLRTDWGAIHWTKSPDRISGNFKWWMESYFQELSEKKTTPRASRSTFSQCYYRNFLYVSFDFHPFNFHSFLLNGRISGILQF